MSLEEILNINIFSGMTSSQLAKFEEFATTESYKTGDILFQLGDNAHFLYIILEGRIDLLLPIQVYEAIKDIRIASREFGEVIAWSSLVPPYKLTSSAKFAVDSKIVAFPAQKLKELFENDPQIGYLFMLNLSKVIGGRLVQVEAMFMRKMQQTIKERFEGGL